MQIDNLNLNNLRVFQGVYKARCMTTAARELHLTQSGVSQHIKSLEQSLGVSLFDRINKKIVPTTAGDLLYTEADQALSKIEWALHEIHLGETTLKGTIRLGMAPEFANNMLIPRLAELGRLHPGIRFKITLDFTSVLNEMLLRGELDFAFVDEFKLDPRIQVETVAEEQLELVATKAYLSSKGRKTKPRKQDKAFFESLEYISYQSGEPVLRSWFGHHLNKKNLGFNVRAQVMDAQCVSRFIVKDLGAGVLPNTLVERLITNGHEIQVFKPTKDPLTNKISLARLKDRSHPNFVRCMMDELRKQL